MGPEAFRFADLYGSLLRRLSMLAALHTDTPFETDFADLMRRAREIDCETALTWLDLDRHSSRQHARMHIGGVIGHIRLDGKALAPFWPLLWLGQFTHAGNAATMGLGHYRIAAASLPSVRDEAGPGDDAGHEHRTHDDRSE